MGTVLTTLLAAGLLAVVGTTVFFLREYAKNRR